MKQNLYDIPGFFEGYKRMRDNRTGLNEVLEQPAMLALLPDIKGLDVLDLGCGAGDFCRRLAALGAHTAAGIDISQNMLELAAREVPAGVTFQQCAMEDAAFPDAAFNLVVSSLAFHYVKNLDQLFNNIHQWLKPDGYLLFSMEHPIATCSQGSHHGWFKDAEGRKICWPVDNYDQEGIRESHWFIQGVIKYHRKVSTILNSLISTGFKLEAVEEPVASAEDEAIWPDLSEARRRPPFLVVKAQK